MQFFQLFQIYCFIRKSNSWLYCSENVKRLKGEMYLILWYCMQRHWYDLLATNVKLLQNLFNFGFVIVRVKIFGNHKTNYFNQDKYLCIPLFMIKLCIEMHFMCAQRSQPIINIFISKWKRVEYNFFDILVLASRNKENIITV